MAKKTSSFHMSNEFNGHGQTTYLSATQYNSYSPLPQTDIRLTPDFGQSIQKALGSLAVMINPDLNLGILLKALGGVSSANQVIIGKSAATGQYTFSYNVSSINEFSNDSYLMANSKNNTEYVFEIVPYGWVPYQSDRKWKWGQENGTYLKEGWHKHNGKWYYFNNYWMITGWKKIFYKNASNWYYFITEKDSSEMETKGHMATKWMELVVDGTKDWYYFGGNGAMVTSDWVHHTDGKWYYMRSGGQMQKSSLRVWKDKLYYLKEDGSMAVSETITDEDSGKTYYANADGVCTEKENVTNQGVNVSDLHPRLKVLQQQLIVKCENAGLKIRITEGVRNVERQNELYAQGRTTPGKIVTYATGTDYKSHHQWGTAFDFCRNDGTVDVYYNKDRFYEKVGAIGKSLGLEWGGDWKDPADMPHFQLPDWGSKTTKLRQMYTNPAEFEKTW